MTHSLARRSTRRPNAVITITSKGAVVDLNEAAEHMLGVRREDALRKRLGRVLAAAEIRAPDLTDFAGALPEDPSRLVDQEFELTAPGADGRFAAELTVAQAGLASPLLIVWMRDISAQKAEESEAARRFAMLGQGEQTAGIGSWDWDMPSGELRWSDNLFRLFGVNPRAFTPTLEHVIERIHEDDRERMRGSVETAAETGHLETLEFGIVQAGGALRRVHSIVASVEQQHGVPYRFVGTVQDVTERRHFFVRRSGEPRPHELTAREREILHLAAQGMSTKAIAHHLTLSPLTVKSHFENIYAKWGVSDRASAVAKALRDGLME